MTRKLKIFLIGITGLLVLGFIIKQATYNGDFRVFLEASKLIQEGVNPYSNWIVSEGGGYRYFYSPLWAILLIPFTHLPFTLVNIIWLCLNLVFLYRVGCLLKEYLPPLPAKGLRVLLVLSLLLTIRLLLNNFQLVQMTIFLLWGAMESLALFDKRKLMLGGALLALVINIKLLPLVLIPYLLYRAYYKGLFATLGFSLLFLILPSLYSGWTQNTLHLLGWWHLLNPTNSSHLVETTLGPHSLTALIPTLFTKTEGVLPISRNITNLSPVYSTYILNSIRAILILVTLFFLKWSPFTPSKSKLDQLRELAYIFMITPLIFPHQQKYAFFLITPAVVYLCHFIIYNFEKRKENMKSATWFTIILLMNLAFISITLSWDDIIGRDLNEISQHFKTITWGTFALIGALILADPKFTIKSTNKIEQTSL